MSQINAVEPEQHKSKGLFIADRILEYLFYQAKGNVSKEDRYAWKIREYFFYKYGSLNDADLQTMLSNLRADNLITIDIQDYDTFDGNIFENDVEVSITDLGIAKAMTHPYMSTVLQLNDINKILIALLCSNGNLYTHDADDREYEWLEMNNSIAEGIFYQIKSKRVLTKYVQLYNNDELLMVKDNKTVELIQFLENGGFQEEPAINYHPPTSHSVTNNFNLNSSTLLYQHGTINSNQTQNIETSTNKDILQLLADLKGSIDILKEHLNKQDIDALEACIQGAEENIDKQPRMTQIMLNGIVDIIKSVPSNIIANLLTNPDTLTSLF
jgi:hypothetical protein